MDFKNKDIVKRIQSRTVTLSEFNYDNLYARPLNSLLTPYDIDRLYNIASSIRYAGNPKKKYKAIDEIMQPRGFQKLSAGTNRIAYKYLEDSSIIVKVAADSVALKDNPREFINQQFLKPFVTKVFEVSPDGVVGLFERVQPITSREEFMSFADDVFDLIWMLTKKYILADFGSKYFMNYGLREGFGAVLLDFPYCYEPDGDKLICSIPDKNNPNTICGGLIDYDGGFNNLICTKCGAKYRANELGKLIKENEIIKAKGKGKKMAAIINKIRMVNGKVVVEPSDSETFGIKTESPVIKSSSIQNSSNNVRNGHGIFINTELLKKAKSTEENKQEKVAVSNTANNVVSDRVAAANNHNNNAHRVNKQDKPLPRVQKFNNKPQVQQFNKKPNIKPNIINNGVPVGITAITFEQLKNLIFHFQSLDLEHGFALFDSVFHTPNKDFNIPVWIKAEDLKHPEILSYIGVEDLSDELEQAKKDLIELEEKNSESNKVITNYKATITELQTNLAHYKGIADDLSVKLKEIEENNTSVDNAAINEKNEQIDVLKSQIEMLNVQVEKYATIIHDKDTEREELISKHEDEMEMLISKYENQIATILSNDGLSNVINNNQKSVSEENPESVEGEVVYENESSDEESYDDDPTYEVDDGHYNGFLTLRAFNSYTDDLANRFGVEVPEEITTKEVLVVIDSNFNNIISDQEGNIAIITKFRGYPIDKLAICVKRVDSEGNMELKELESLNGFESIETVNSEEE